MHAILRRVRERYGEGALYHEAVERHAAKRHTPSKWEKQRTHWLRLYARFLGQSVDRLLVQTSFAKPLRDF